MKKVLLLMMMLLAGCLVASAQPPIIKPPTKPVDTPTKPKPTTGTLKITSTPSGAAVKIDGKYKGETPLTLEKQKAGSYNVTLSAEGYESQTQSVTVTAGKTATCSATLKKKQVAQPVVQQPTTPTVPTTPPSPSSQTFTANGVSFKMIRVEGSTFTMGATSEQGSNTGADEEATHRVTLSGYYIGETEVTQALWEVVMGTSVSDQRDKANKEWPLRGVGSNYPMYYVSWDECQDFIRKLNALTGKSFRLPTEAEWEYAARGGNQSQGYKYSGSNTLGDVAWYGDNSGNETHPVKTKTSNELGIYDMSGNVREWCADLYGSYNSSAQTNPTGATSGSDRVRRGGSWSSFAGYCRVASRDRDTPVNRFNNLGFRLAL